MMITISKLHAYLRYKCCIDLPQKYLLMPENRVVFTITRLILYFGADSYGEIQRTNISGDE